MRSKDLSRLQAPLRSCTPQIWSSNLHQKHLYKEWLDQISFSSPSTEEISVWGVSPRFWSYTMCSDIQSSDKLVSEAGDICDLSSLFSRFQCIKKKTLCKLDLRKKTYSSVHQLSWCSDASDWQNILVGRTKLLPHFPSCSVLFQHEPQ